MFGKLDTLGEDERDVKRNEALERDALAVQRLVFGDGGGGEGGGLGGSG